MWILGVQFWIRELFQRQICSGNICRRRNESPVKSMLLEGDVSEVLPRLPDASVQCVVTSPPYWGLRDYGIRGQVGLEATLTGYLNKLTSIFGEVRRILKSDGILWLNIGD